MAENNLAGSVFEALEAATDDIAASVAQKEAVAAQIRSGKFSREELERNYFPKDAELKSKIRHDSEDAIRNAHRIVAAYREECEKKNVLDASLINDDAKFLQGNIKLNEKDINDLLERNADNRTMSILILRYAKEHGLKVDGRHKLRQQAEAKECDDLDAVISLYQRWIAHPRGKEMLNKFFVSE